METFTCSILARKVFFVRFFKNNGFLAGLLYLARNALLGKILQEGFFGKLARFLQEVYFFQLGLECFSQKRAQKHKMLKRWKQRHCS